MNRLRILLLVFLALVPPATPAEEGKPLSRLAFGSCIHQDRDQTIWTPIVAFKPERFLFLGDNIYADTQDIDAMRKMYAQMAAQPGYQKLLAACPIVGTWDDHDYGGDDAGADYPKKKESQEAFLDFFRVARDSPQRKQNDANGRYLFSDLLAANSQLRFVVPAGQAFALPSQGNAIFDLDATTLTGASAVFSLPRAIPCPWSASVRPRAAASATASPICSPCSSVKWSPFLLPGRCGQLIQARSR